MATKKNKIKDLEYYLNLPWTFIFETSKDNKNKSLFVVKVNELPGIISDGYTVQEAYEAIQEAMTLAFEMYLEAGFEIPAPISY